MSLQSRFDRDVLLVGWAHSPFGKLADDTLETLIVRVAGEAIAASGLEPNDIDAIFLGQFNPGFVPLHFSSSLALQLSDDLAGVPATRVENACASGSAALQQGVTSILAGTANNVLVIGAEKMTSASAEVVGAGLLAADYDSAGLPSSTGFAGLFARVADAYFERYGEDEPGTDSLASIAAKSHHNALSNPFAHLRKDFDEEFCATVSERNPLVAGRLRRTDCSPVSDGAAAIVLRGARVAGAATDPVRLTGFGHANDFLPGVSRDPIEFAGSRTAWRRALDLAGVDSHEQLSFIELHDCFTIAELVLYEALGLAERGEGRRVVAEGWVQRDGRLPVNLSGGLKSKGHPVGATGVSQHVIAAMQLSGTAGELQLPGASRGAVHNMGGLAVANYVSVVEAV